MKQPKRGRGRPSIPVEERMVKTAASLPINLRDFAKELGSGKLSRGIQIALSEAMAKRKST